MKPIQEDTVQEALLKALIGAAKNIEEDSPKVHAAIQKKLAINKKPETNVTYTLAIKLSVDTATGVIKPGIEGRPPNITDKSFTDVESVFTEGGLKVRCETCGGSGKDEDQDPCSDCGGKGSKEDLLKTPLPATEKTAAKKVPVKKPWELSKVS